MIRLNGLIVHTIHSIYIIYFLKASYLVFYFILLYYTSVWWVTTPTPLSLSWTWVHFVGEWSPKKKDWNHMYIWIIIQWIYYFTALIFMIENMKYLLPILWTNRARKIWLQTDVKANLRKVLKRTGILKTQKE